MRIREAVIRNSMPIVIGLLVLLSSCTVPVIATGTGTAAAPIDVHDDSTAAGDLTVAGSGVSSSDLALRAESDAYAQTDARASDTNATSEGAYEQSVPEKGDPYFEAVASDGSWISYENPRDEYRSPYQGDGSAKICVALYNENGEPIVGETVPNTTVTIPTGDAIGWHSSADPITVQLPLTEHYDRPLDADQFGTSEDLPQGDGYLDSHCYEFHGLSEDATVDYGEAQVDGEYANRIDVVGYIQHEHSAWDSDIDPLVEAEPYEEAGGGWTYRADGSHGQVVVVLQLDSSKEQESGDDIRDGNGSAGDADTEDETTDMTDETENDSAGESNATNGGMVEEANRANATNEAANNSTEAPNGADNAAVNEENTVDAEAESDTNREDDEMPGFGLLIALLTFSIIILTRRRR
ncbi:PGF-CTERM sorting domain-containing protein [Halalkalicoccus sp. GCM10025704]